MKVKLYAQPFAHEPFLKTEELEEGVYEEGGAFTRKVISFTDIGKAVWSTATGMSPNNSISLMRGEGLNWLVAIETNTLKVNLFSEKYKGISQDPHNFYIVLLIEGDKSQVIDFTNQLSDILSRAPWEFSDFDKFTEETDVSEEELVDAWEACLNGKPTEAAKIIPPEEEIEPPKMEPKPTKPVKVPEPLTKVDWRVLDYISKHDGELSIPKASKDLDLSEEKLETSLKRLKEMKKLEEY